MANKLHILTALFLLCCSVMCEAQKNTFSGGYSYSTYLSYNKTVQSWGDNYYGQLGRTTETGAYIVPSAIPNVENIVSIDAGFGSFCCALTSEGNVLSWGHNFYGELGVGQDCPGVCENRTADTVVGGETGTPLLENVIAIAIGQMHAYALLSTGEVVAWGNNTYGQLGDGTTVSHNVPTYVKTTPSKRLTNVKMIAAGGNNGYALTEDGHVYAWGDNQANQLACGDSDTHYFPVAVVDKNGEPISDITTIDGGMFFALLLNSDKTVYGTGAYKGTHLDKSGSYYKTNSYAELVKGGETPNYYLENVTAISAGFSHAMAIVQENGSQYAVAWGDNKFPNLSDTRGGQLGIGLSSTKQFNTPVYVKTSANTKINNVTAINAGCGVSYIEKSIGKKQNNQFYVCGYNDDGQLGLGDKYDRNYATLLQSVEVPYCGSYSLEPTKTLCTPLYFNIKIPFSLDSHTLEWYKNNEKIEENNNLLHIEDTGTYKVKISDKTGDCPDRETQITINEKEPDFQIIPSSFCSDEITFKVIGDGVFKWYKTYDNYLIGRGNSISTSKLFCDEIHADSIYQVWVEHENKCQPIPVNSVKKCDCNVPSPILTDSVSFCYNKKNIISTSGDSIVWYADSLLTKPLTLQDTLTINNNQIGTFIYYATQLHNRCESEKSETNVTLFFCEPWYYVSGAVTEPDGTPVENADVVLYCSNSEKPTDQCTTDKNGTFSLITNKCVGKIVAKSPSSTYIDTWAGNTADKNHAYQFNIDADIKHIAITLIPPQTAISSTSLDDIWKQSVSASIFNIEGKLLKKIPLLQESDIRQIQQFKQPVIVVVTDKNGERQAFILKK